VKNAKETKGRVDLELEDLEATLKNIEEARPFDELTVVCVTGTAHFTKDGANGYLRLGRSRCCSPRHRREDISTRFQGALVSTRLQGMFELFGLRESHQVQLTV
jgi:hypothetical protein